MSEDNFQDIKKNGINLALDPNLINLPLYTSSFSPTGKSETFTGTANSEEADVELKVPLDKKLNDANTKSINLINNPYEVFGKLPLAQLIPLISQQKGPGFTFGNLSEDELLREIQQEEELEKNNNVDELIDRFPDSNKMDMDILPLEDDTAKLSDLSTTQGADESSMDFNSQNHELLGDGIIAINNDTKEFIPQANFEQIRKQMIDDINLAINESSLSLEFVSLLLSGAREQSALSSMSPFLKKTVSPGSLNSEKIPHETKSKKDEQMLAILDKGWKLKSLDDSRQMLKENYAALTKTLQREHEYWRKLATNISNKDVIFKLRDYSTNQRVLGIKYGYGDSGSTYRYDKGIALLRNNVETNKLELVPTSKGSIEHGNELQNYERFIRIRIYTRLESEDDSVLSGESSISNEFLNNNFDSSEKNSDSIRSQISRLKAFIFEKELMHHLKKECSELISFGVVVENENKIVLELSNEKIEIDFVSLQDPSVVNHEQDSPRVNDKRANLILVTLRMLLVVMFKKEIRQTMISSKRNITKSADEILLVKPILGKIRHHSYKVILRRILKDYVLGIIPEASIKEEAVSASEDVNSSEDGRKKVALDKHIETLTNEIEAFEYLLELPVSKFDITLPMMDNKAATINLLLKNPNYCNAVIDIKYLDKNGVTIFNTTFTEFKEVEEFLSFIVSEYSKDKSSLIKNDDIKMEDVN
ncbi:hypothetical protein TPHA_0I03030 [Tetrapisispora phaffii CBS 4417]|uniref:Mediator of RNA polymerase II transcription subunit 17 n=1 Tax=Tetrapisispora phaffii (strain ATCC 24235 / CBS 4417 / NBRC 1672 / NRRL Y-8282 / UCD 70-5) TaxID=1071381 RepID=G8BY26_TETPH|nr:hypothetical protein TPHA_0I03030 [Tetrapisispora phaffii CBS 4417]CCE64804.1 hypothetical protein TPHA_0I03030 [Tetrapisispora phaffii CBS 4417]